MVEMFSWCRVNYCIISCLDYTEENIICLRNILFGNYRKENILFQNSERHIND